jgi:hypothetical protein
VAAGGGTGETPASGKRKYESNDDTNPYADADAGTVATVGNVADLTTAAKETLVDAVNEVVATFEDDVPTSRAINRSPLDADIRLSSSDIGSEPAISTGTTFQYYRGDKSWQDFATSVRASALTGLSTATNSPITASDTAITAFQGLSTLRVSTPAVYGTFSSIFDADLYGCYAVYFSGIIPSCSNDVSLFMQFLSGTTPRNGISDNITFNSWESGTTYAPAETVGKYFAITGVPISSPAQVACTAGAFGSMLIAAPATAGRAQLIGSATTHTR